MKLCRVARSPVRIWRVVCYGTSVVTLLGICYIFGIELSLTSPDTIKLVQSIHTNFSMLRSSLLDPSNDHHENGTQKSDVTNTTELLPKAKPITLRNYQNSTKVVARIKFVARGIKITTKDVYTKTVSTLATPQPPDLSRIRRGKGANGVDISLWDAVLARYASREKQIILALVDSAFLAMTLNFYETSIQRWNITNFLFVASGKTACTQLKALQIPCYVYMEDKSEKVATVYGSKDFKRKMNIRTFMILDALNLGYDVLHTDVDMVFQKNPLNDIKCANKCDMAILWDFSTFNAGFLLVRATAASRAVYKKMDHTARHTSQDDQLALNGAIKHVGKKVAVNRLDVHKYVCGYLYFEKPKRYYADDKQCNECIVIHNNWIVSREAKTYRFKETQMWVYDGDQYYSSIQREYLTYSNPALFKSKALTLAMEKRAFQNALAIGQILDRVVIIPKFHCDNKWTSFCPLNSLYKIQKLDSKFENKYRESTFLTHPKVPPFVKESISDTIYINTNSSSTQDKNATVDTFAFEKFTPQNPAKGATSHEIKDWFGKRSEKVLRIHSLYDAFSEFSDKDEGKLFHDIVKVSFVKGGYRNL